MQSEVTWKQGGSACLAAILLAMAGCATPPGSDAHRGLGQKPDEAAVAALVWVPDSVEGPVWMQFERRNAAGAPTGLPVSVLVIPPQQVWHDLPQRPGWRSHLVAFPLPPGGHVLSRWVAQMEGHGMVVSGYVGWPFDALAGSLVHLGQITLDIQARRYRPVTYQLRTAPAAQADADLVRRNLDALVAWPWTSAPGFGAAEVSGSAAISGTSDTLLQPNTSVYIP